MIIWFRLIGFIHIYNHLIAGVMWPSPNPAWRSSAGPTPGPHVQPVHYPTWTSTTSTSATPTISFQGQHAPAPHPRDLLPPQPGVHQYPPPAAPSLPPHSGFGLPPAEPPTPVLTQATQMFSDVLQQFVFPPTPTPSPCSTATPSGPRRHPHRNLHPALNPSQLLRHRSRKHHPPSEVHSNRPRSK